MGKKNISTTSLKTSLLNSSNFFLD